MIRRITYLNHAGGVDHPKLQLECELCPNATLILAHQDPVKVAKELGWIRIENVPRRDGTEARHFVLLCPEHTVVHHRPEGDITVQSYPTILGGKGR